MSLLAAPIGCVPIVWNNADQPDLAPETPRRRRSSTRSRGSGSPARSTAAASRRATCCARRWRGAACASRSCTPRSTATEDGLAPRAADIARRDLGRLVAGGGEVLVVAVDGRRAARPMGGARRGRRAPMARGRVRRAGGPAATSWRRPRPTGCASRSTRTAAPGSRIPTRSPPWPSACAGTGAGLCLDVGHYLVGGGDPVDAIGRYGSLIVHVHAKDVDPAVLARLRAGELEGLGDAVRERIFTELGNGALDLDGVLRGLDRIGYDGWLMVEQDSSRLRPSEAAAIGRRVLEYARHVAVREAVA